MKSGQKNASLSASKVQSIFEVNETLSFQGPLIEEEPVEEASHLVERVGILGGTFNPPHLGHLIIAEQVATQLGLEKIYFMPSHIPPHAEEKKTIDAKHRISMTELAILDNPAFAIETIEMERQEKSYTYETISLLHQRYPNREYYFIIGGDMVENLPLWKEIDQLIQEVTFVGVERRGYAKESPYPILWVDCPILELSSTEIRSKVFFDQSIRYMVTDEVLNYIKKEGLYKDDYQE